MKTYMGNKNKIPKDSLWIKLSKGSSIIEAEADNDPGNLEWPNEADINAMVNTITQSPASPEAPPGITMAERVRDVMDPLRSEKVIHGETQGIAGTRRVMWASAQTMTAAKTGTFASYRKKTLI